MWGVVLLLALSLSGSYSDLLLGPGDTYIYSFISLPNVVSISPGLPVYDDYSFSVVLSGDLYYKPPDDIRIRLYENPGDIIPVHDIFGESVPNLSVTPSNISILEVPGTLWFDSTGRIEVEVLEGNVNLHHLYIDLGPGPVSYSSYIEVVPEPGSLTLVLIGTGGLLSYRRSRCRKDSFWNTTVPLHYRPDEPARMF